MERVAYFIYVRMVLIELIKNNTEIPEYSRTSYGNLRSR